MRLSPVDTFDAISPEEFKKHYYEKQKPVVIRNLSHHWKAFDKWNWDYLVKCAGHKTVGVYNNVKSDANTPINKPDGELLFSHYIDMVRKGPVELRIFLFNIFKHAPALKQDFEYPEELMPGFLKKFPMLFVGGMGSITHMHFDMDLSHVLHTQFAGRKRVLLFEYNQGEKLYRLPFSVLSMINFHDFYTNSLNEEKFPSIKQLEGYEFTLNHGDTLFMPSGYWHHMEYLDAGFALSMRALDQSYVTRLRGVSNLVLMRNFDTLMKKLAPQLWANYKEATAMRRGLRYVNENVPEPEFKT